MFSRRKFIVLWGSDNICINKNKKFGAKKCGEAHVYGVLLFLWGWSYANNENGWDWLKMGGKCVFICIVIVGF